MRPGSLLLRDVVFGADSVSHRRYIPQRLGRSLHRHRHPRRTAAAAAAAAAVRRRLLRCGCGWCLTRLFLKKIKKKLAVLLLW